LPAFPCENLPSAFLPPVATEMALYVLAYNMIRVMNLMGIPAIIAAMKA
jgi:hypothetical protein